MMRTVRAAFLLLAAGAVLHGAPILTLIPSSITGGPGDTIGWSFTIDNSTNWVEITNASFCLGTSGTNTACVLSTLGAFTDFISGFNDIVVGPAPDTSNVGQSLSLGSHTGVGSFSINLNAPLFVTDSGQIVLTYNLFSRSPNDPLFSPDTDTISSDNFLTAAADVTAVPEPAGMGMVSLGVILFGSVRRAITNRPSTPVL